MGYRYPPNPYLDGRCPECRKYCGYDFDRTCNDCELEFCDEDLDEYDFIQQQSQIETPKPKTSTNYFAVLGEEEV